MQGEIILSSVPPCFPRHPCVVNNKKEEFILWFY